MGTATKYDEQELVSLLKSRDSKAFEYLYDNYSAALYSIISQIVPDMDLANDVLQEVFINVYRKIESYDQAKGRLFTWLLNIARNASIDMIRSKGYQRTKKNLELEEESFESRSIQGINVDFIGFRKTIERLKEDYRSLIELAYFKGYTHEEIAEIKQLPLGTVKTRIRTALIQLREYLK